MPSKRRVWMQPARLAMLVALCGGPAAALALPDSHREAGDLISLALPVGTLAVELGRRDWQGAARMVEVFVLTTGGTEVLKRLTAIERPDGADRLSFPSGHAARAFSAAAYVQQRHGTAQAWPLWGLATYVGATRVHANRHRWIDVGGAAMLSMAVAHWRVTPVAGQLTLQPQPEGGLQLAWQWPLQ